MSKTVKPSRTVPPEAKKAGGAKTTGETVTVACKMPNGIEIRGMVEATRSVPLHGGGMRDEKYFKHDGRVVKIYGPAKPFGQEARTRVVGGYALTDGVDAELFAQWIRDNKELPAVQEGMIFAMSNIEDAAQESRGNARLKSGLEPLNPNGDHRQPQPMETGIGEVTVSDTQTINVPDEEMA